MLWIRVGPPYRRLMPGDFIIRTGDMVQVTITPPAAVSQLSAPVPLTGSSANLIVLGAARIRRLPDSRPGQRRGVGAAPGGTTTQARPA
jgi:hypothetical protein